MIRRTPVETALLGLLPVTIAIGQLGNSVVTGLPFTISIPFAVVMIGFAGVLNQYRFARFRRRELESSIFATDD